MQTNPPKTPKNPKNKKTQQYKQPHLPPNPPKSTSPPTQHTAPTPQSPPNPPTPPSPQPLPTPPTPPIIGSPYAVFLRLLLVLVLVEGVQGACYAGMNNCAFCDSGDVCLTCGDGFGTVPVAGNGVLVVCVACSVGQCRLCAAYNACTACNTGYYLLSPTACSPCPTNCQQCTPTTCTKCTNGHGLYNNNCQPCAKPNCLSCSFTQASPATDPPLENCLQCNPRFGFIPGGNNQCGACQVAGCVACGTNNWYCGKCEQFKAVIWNGFGHQCVDCQTNDTRCLQCYGNNPNNCLNCAPSYGLKYNDPHCTECQDTNCSICSSYFKICTVCKPDFRAVNYKDGSNNVVQGYCTECMHPCAKCEDGNLGSCLVCQVDYTLNTGTNTCHPTCISNCQICTTLTSCDTCNPNFMRTPTSPHTCQPCPTHCSLCTQSSTQTPQIQCTACLQPQIYKLNTTSHRCEDFCGDGIGTDLPCDFVGVDGLYDGCTDFCGEEDGFWCQGNDKMWCSYTKVIGMEIVGIEDAGERSNQYTVYVKISPPLQVFSTSSTLAQVFLIPTPTFQLYSLTYTQTQSLLTFHITQTEPTPTPYQFIIRFVPNQDADSRYRLTPQAETRKWHIFEYKSRQELEIVDFVWYGSWVVAVMGLVGVGIGVGGKRLAGIEGLVVYQVGWVCMVFANSKLWLGFRNVYPLGYTTGYRHQFIENSTRLLTSQPTYTPHLPQFSLSTIFLNNFNLPLALQLVPLTLYLITSIILKCMTKKQLKLKANFQFEQSLQMKIKIIRCRKAKELGAQCLLCFGMANVVNFTLSGGLFMAGGAFWRDGVNFGVFVGVAVVYVVTLVVFCCDPDPFDYFRYAFKRTRLAMLFYYFYGFIIASSVILIMVIPEHVWAPIIPFALVLLYIIAYRPYIEPKQNLRSAFNLLVIITCLSIRIYLKHAPPTTPQLDLKHRSTIYEAVNIALMLLVLIISYVSMIYYIIYECFFKSKDKLTDEEKVMCELDEIKVRERMCEAQDERLVFKKLLEPQMNVLNFSNSLQMHCQYGSVNSKEYNSVENRTKEIKQKLQTHKINTYKKYTNNKIEYINNLKQVMQKQQQQNSQRIINKQPQKNATTATTAATNPHPNLNINQPTAQTQTPPTNNNANKTKN